MYPDPITGVMLLPEEIACSEVPEVQVSQYPAPDGGGVDGQHLGAAAAATVAEVTSELQQNSSGDSVRSNSSTQTSKQPRISTTLEFANSKNFD